MLDFFFFFFCFFLLSAFEGSGVAMVTLLQTTDAGFILQLFPFLLLLGKQEQYYYY